MRLLLFIIDIDALFKTTVKVKLDGQGGEIVDQCGEVARPEHIICWPLHAESSRTTGPLSPGQSGPPGTSSAKVVGRRRHR